MTNIDKELIESTEEAVAIAEVRLEPARVILAEGVDVAAIRIRLLPGQE